MLASSILPPGTVAHLKLYVFVRGKTDPAVVAWFCLTLSFCRVEGKGRVGQLECNKRCCRERTVLYDT